MKAAAIQMTSGADLQSNLLKSKDLVASAAQKGASFVLLPECFCFLGLKESNKFEVSESLNTDSPGPILQSLIDMALEHNIWISGAGIPEKKGDSAYNSLALVSPQGELVSVYRKMHLFDVELPGTRLCESDATVPGTETQIAETDFGNIGLSICYDLRFPELYRKMTFDKGVRIIVVPAAFTAKTGPAHWHVLLRARAIENQCFVVAAGQTGRHNPKRASYGHSLIVSPWGTVLSDAGDKEGMAIADLDFEEQDTLRTQMPCLSHRVM